MDVAELGGLRLREGEAGMVEAGSTGCSWETAGIDLPWQQQFCACSRGRHVVPGSWGPESMLPPNIKGVEGSGMDVLDHIPVHAAAGAAPAAGLACMERLVNAKENIRPIELPLCVAVSRAQDGDTGGKLGFRNSLVENSAAPVPTCLNRLTPG